MHVRTYVCNAGLTGRGGNEGREATRALGVAIPPESYKPEKNFILPPPPHKHTHTHKLSNKEDVKLEGDVCKLHREKNFY